MDDSLLSRFLSGAMSYRQASKLMQIMSGRSDLPLSEQLTALTDAELTLQSVLDMTLLRIAEARANIMSE